MDGNLPDKFEYVIIGTGVPESLISAALSRIGKTVLHIDRNENYSGLWATFSLSDFNSWMDRMLSQETEDERTNELHKNLRVIRPEREWGEALSPEEEGGEGESVWTRSKLQRLDRHFNIDIFPKFVFAKGATVDNLLQSDAGRYLEFHPIRRLIAVKDDGEMLRVPANRSELFKTRHLQPRQKWQISSFLQWCVGAALDDPKVIEYESRPLRELLSEWKGMDTFCQQIVINTMGLSRMDILTRPGIERLQHMLSSMNRYGPYPFLWPLYGSGELPQAYCRFSAVFGGVYCLGRTVDEVSRDEDGRCEKIVLSSGENITVEKAIVSHSGYLPTRWTAVDSKQKHLIARAIFLTTGQFFQESQEPGSTDDRDISIMCMPMDGCDEPALVIELPSESKGSPRGTYLVHMTATIADPPPDVSARLFFEPIANRLFSSPGEGESTRPSVIWSAFFFLPDFPRERSADCPSNVHLLTGPDNSLDFDSAIDASKRIFEELCPGEPYLPKAPSADEILHVGEDEQEHVEIPNPGVGEDEEQQTGDN